MSGWMIPCSRIESTSSCNWSALNAFRGWSGPGTISVRGTRSTRSPGSIVGGLGVLIRAPSPLPRTTFAITGLKLLDQPGQSKEYKEYKEFKKPEGMPRQSEKLDCCS